MYDFLLSDSWKYYFFQTNVPRIINTHIIIRTIIIQYCIINHDNTFLFLKFYQAVFVTGFLENYFANNAVKGDIYKHVIILIKLQDT